MQYLPFIRITRPANSLAVGVLALVSCVAASSREGVSYSTAVATLSCILLAAGGYVVNDAFDYETDRLVHKERVLPRGEMDDGVARMYGMALLIVSPLLFLIINPVSFFNASIAALLLFLYSWKLKSTDGIIGNFITALLAGDATLIGGFVTGRFGLVLPLAACVFFATLSREIAKDIEDWPGDRITRARTIPRLMGRKNASRLAALFLSLAVLTTYLPYQRVIFHEAYLVVASVVNAAVLYTAARLALKASEHIDVTQRLIKMEMFLYILIFLFSIPFNAAQGA